jgi:hypothetical protein
MREPGRVDADYVDCCEIPRAFAFPATLDPQPPTWVRPPCRDLVRSKPRLCTRMSRLGSIPTVGID